MLANAPTEGEIFAGNRATGRVQLSTMAVAGGSRRQRVHEAGALRVRFPSGDPNNALEAVILNTAGGMTGGDRFNIDISVGAGARLIVTTAAAEKVYRSLGPDAQVDVQIEVGPGGALGWLPQQTILFDRSRLRRCLEITLAPGAHLLAAETIVFGRSAMGETVDSGHFFDRWRVRLGGALVFAETLRFDGEIARSLARRAVTAKNAAFASILKIPGDDAGVTAVRAIENKLVGEVGASAWNGLMVARLLAPDGAALNRDLVGVLTALSDMPLPRLWFN